jgi:hypothetical protein
MEPVADLCRLFRTVRVSRPHKNKEKVMHWMDVLHEPGLTETYVASVNGNKAFAMRLFISDFAAPSWNRLLGMHHMERMKLRSLIHNIVCESISGRTPSTLALQEYDVLNRPSKKKKLRLKELRKQQVPERRRLSRMLKNGYEREQITDRPVELNGPIAINFHHFRHRKIDNDNLSGKAMLDSLVEIGLLPDDGPEVVYSVTHQQGQVPRDSEEAVGIELLEIPRSVINDGYVK